MAEKKSTKKATEAKKVNSLEDLQKQLETQRKDLLQAKLGNQSGELQNPRAITKLRKEIARTMTAISQLKHKEGEK